MSLKNYIFILTMLIIITLILSGCSNKLDDYSNMDMFYLETIDWETSMEDIIKLNSKSNNIQTLLNVRGLERENDHMVFQNIIYGEIQGYISYGFFNNKKLYSIEYALLENKGEEKYNPLNLSMKEIYELDEKKEKYKNMDFELDYIKLANYINNNKDNETNNDEIIMWYKNLVNKYGEPSKISMPEEDNLRIEVFWSTQDTNISLIARQNGLAGERRDLIVRYYKSIDE
ncbi:hypothetical protein [Alkaliphilus peptidifermentans]|uniref:Lipoprotein n=1 Tax=Alkaliphilus peptidifermentans DSM 18978 TaxID=1120976 RepID=A0A1G5GX59_9FIRM|nr:hypothetical protein [Alkaliphilus peptidifermentans]SCY56195.1 hypothetical protein SAMN03080606_01820 [Alkaliphilus peptidifermentans DSM 18978]